MYQNNEVSMSKYNKLKESYKALTDENDHLNNTALKLKDLVDDLNQKKNKLNFLIFLWMKEGYPVNRIYKNDVEPIDSHRFDILTPSKIKNSIKKMNENKAKNKSKSQGPTMREGTWIASNMKESFEQLPESFFNDVNESQILNKSHEISHQNISIDLNGSYEPIVKGLPEMPKKLTSIPILNFK